LSHDEVWTADSRHEQVNGPPRSSKAERRAARDKVAAYHEAQLAKLLANVRAE